jgi:UPF0755 protein
LKRAFIAIGVLILLFAVYIYALLFRSNTGEFGDSINLFIPTGSSYAAVLKLMEEQHVVRDIRSFDRMARRLGYPKLVKAGKYQIKKGMGNYPIVHILRSGKQTPVKLVLNKLRTKEDIIQKLCSSLEIDSSELQSLLRDSTFLTTYGIDSNQVQVIIIPDTYQFFWNTGAKKAIEKIAKNHSKFWTNDRKEKAASLKLSIPQVVTLASIVEEESNIHEDKLRIASTYLNRLQKNMPLQADPTVKFAVGDFTLKRILNVHTQIPSPYNTYVRVGLPPGPICTPSKKTIDVVLDAPKANFLYFCASESLDGSSNFATNYTDHLANARRYQDALNKRGIR